MVAYRNSVLILGAIVAGVLAGCAPTPSETPPAALSERQTDSDKVPATVATALEETSNDEGRFDLATSRLDGERDGRAFYLGESTEEDGYCLVVYETDDVWGSGCSSGPPIYALTIQLRESVEARLIASGTPMEDGWELVGENVAMRELPLATP